MKNRLDPKILVTTQKLTPEFCAKYIYYGNIEGGGEETYTLDVCYILRHQTHIIEKELTDLHLFSFKTPIFEYKDFVN